MPTQATDSATTLRLMVHGLLAKGLISAQLAEQALLEINALDSLARMGQQLGALGRAATAPTSVIAPTLKTRPIGRTTFARHEHLSREGKPPASESAADRKAREQAASLGFDRGRFVGTPRPTEAA